MYDTYIYSKAQGTVWLSDVGTRDNLFKSPMMPCDDGHDCLYYFQQSAGTARQAAVPDPQFVPGLDFSMSRSFGNEDDYT
jgi:hypothetical protein